MIFEFINGSIGKQKNKQNEKIKEITHGIFSKEFNPYSTIKGNTPGSEPASSPFWGMFFEKEENGNFSTCVIRYREWIWTPWF